MIVTDYSDHEVLECDCSAPVELDGAGRPLRDQRGNFIPVNPLKRRPMTAQETADADARAAAGVATAEAARQDEATRAELTAAVKQSAPEVHELLSRLGLV